MSKKPKPKAIMVGRIIIQTPEEQAAEAARLLKGQFARNKASHKPRGVSGWKVVPYVPTNHSVRPGADNALAIPSRFGDQLRYRDGRVVDIATPLKTQP